jgi:hypothetical protein
LFPDSTPSPNRSTRQAQLEAITNENEEAFEELDAESDRYPDDVGELLAKFWAAHFG